MDQKAHDLGESVVHNFKANLHILLALWLSEMCSLPLQLQGSRFHKQKHTMPCVFFFFFFWLAVQCGMWDLSSQKVNVKVTQSCPTLCDPMNCIVHGILQARILEWVAFPFSRGSSQPRNRTQVCCIAGGFLTSWATRIVPRPGIKPMPPALRAWSLSHWTTGKFQHDA